LRLRAEGKTGRLCCSRRETLFAGAWCLPVTGVREGRPCKADSEAFGPRFFYVVSVRSARGRLSAAHPILIESVPPTRCDLGGLIREQSPVTVFLAPEGEETNRGFDALSVGVDEKASLAIHGDGVVVDLAEM